MNGEGTVGVFDKGGTVSQVVSFQGIGYKLIFGIVDAEAPESGGPVDGWRLRKTHLIRFSRR